MKDRFITRLAVAWCFAIVCVVSASSAPLDCEPLEWRGGIYPNNRNYFEIEIDARKIPTNQYLQSIFFQLTFYDNQNRHIPTEALNFTNEPSQGLDPAFYVIYLKHTYNSSSSAKGGNMTFYCKRRGLAYAVPESRVPVKEARCEEYPAGKDFIAIGTPKGSQISNVKSASDYAGFWININPKLHFIQFIEIVADTPNSLKIRSWLRCHPTPGEGGGLKDCLYWEEDEVDSSSFEAIIWKHDESHMDGESQRTITFKNILTLEGGDTLHVFTESQGWNNYFKRGKRP